MTEKTESAGTLAAVSLTGVYQVSAFFDPMGNFLAGLAKIAIEPDGTHYIKLSALSGGKTQVQFCDASGNTSGFNPGNPSAIPPTYGDFDYATTKHYWKNQMPLSLAFPNVSFTYDDTTGNITNGNGVTAMARANGNPNGVLPGFITPSQDSDSTAAIITTTGNTPTAFSIRVKLGFQLPFEVVLTKI